MRFSTWNIDASEILSRQEIASVLADLHQRAAQLPNVQMNLAIVRLACCCGLRASEIGGLSLGDVRVGVSRPHLLVRAEHAKLHRPAGCRCGGTPARWLTWRRGSPLGANRAPKRATRSFVRSNGRRSARRSTGTSYGGGSIRPAWSWAGTGYGR